MRKLRLITIFGIIAMLLLTACSYVAYKTYYTNTDDYLHIWALSGVREGSGEISDLFPKEIENLSVEEFFCRYDEQLPLGEGVQVFLSVRYEDEAAFSAELERIYSLAYSCDEEFPNSEMSAYATSIESDSLWEYTLIDEQQNLVNYVYLRYVPIDEIEFDVCYIPASMNDD